MVEHTCSKRQTESEKEMKTSKLVNDYVKADKEAASVNAEIKAQTEDLQIKLKALKKRREDLKNAIMKELEASNSKRLESKTNFVIWDPTDVAAHVRNNILVNKEPKPKSE
tara:strand:+ start:317 stop:649 length:333 start_codon:yes stop_codon:yes gene_type:complete